MVPAFEDHCYICLKISKAYPFFHILSSLQNPIVFFPSDTQHFVRETDVFLFFNLIHIFVIITIVN